ncbi:MAG: threonine/serine exporter family protein [Ardenticatenaceae bacterium]|nr:threonine/serine exporter family protein [Ardenticatenaceae bacterium]MCB9445575.1 threonine/serine exporter family protein [Ardenticatenaceae bacterium]
MNGWDLLQNIIWAGVAALGFAILFNVPKRTLFACALSGSVAYAVRTLLTNSGYLGIEAATLMGAAAVGFLGVPFGRRWHAPAIIFVIPGVIPLVPGALAFRTMIDLLNLTTATGGVTGDLLTVTAVNSLKTVLIVGGIAGGVAMPSLLLRRYRPMT